MFKNEKPRVKAHPVDVDDRRERVITPLRPLVREAWEARAITHATSVARSWETPSSLRNAAVSRATL
jgi:hypothetical protein